MLNKSHWTNIAIMVLSLLFIVSCNNSNDQKQDVRKQFRNEEGLVIKRTFYEEEGEETNVLTEKTFKVENGDTILHGNAKSFYQNGQLMGEEHYRDGVKYGISQQFYPNGQTKHKGWLKEGKLDSVGLAYYENGQIKVKGYFHNDHKVGEQLHYYKNGKIKAYSLYNPVGEPVYLREYSDNGELTNEEGTKNTQLIYKGEDATFTPGETLHVTIYAPTPPDSKVDLSVSITDKNGQSVVDSQKVPIKNGKAVYKRELNEPGQYYFKTSLFFKDLKTGEEQTFDNAFEYTVVKE